MSNTYEIYLISDSTGETLDRIFLALKAQFDKIEYKINQYSLPTILKKKPKLTCIVGLTTEPERLVDIRRNRINTLKEKKTTTYLDYEKISKEVIEAKKLFKKYNWPIVDVTRKSVEETAASVIKIYEIVKQNV